MTGPRRSAGAAHHGLLLIDDHVMVACTPADALACLGGPDTIAAWFGARRRGAHTTITTPSGDLDLVRTHEEWQPGDGVFTIDGTAGPLRFHAHLTARAVIRPDAARILQQSTEVWVHVEVAPAASAQRAGSIMAAAIAHGLEHLRLELDAAPDP